MHILNHTYTHLCPLLYLAAASKPEGPVVDECGRNFVSLSWRAPSSDGGKPISGYNIEARQNMTGNWVCMSD